MIRAKVTKKGSFRGKDDITILSRFTIGRKQLIVALIGAGVSALVAYILLNFGTELSAALQPSFLIMIVFVFGGVVSVKSVPLSTIVIKSMRGTEVRKYSKKGFDKNES